MGEALVWSWPMLKEAEMRRCAVKTPRRPHYIEEWMETRGLSQVELARAIGADKSSISRWLDGTCPSKEWQEKLGQFFGCGRDGIFRHPDEDWMKRFFEDRTSDDVERIKMLMDLNWPKEKRGDS
jgi:transcriptional regulator with XRE-family HTH domain